MSEVLPHRRVRFEWPDDLDVIWTPDAPELSIAADAVSLLMPHAEPYVVAVTRAALDEGLIADPAVAAAALAYLTQEAGHHAQHRRFNDAIAARAPGIARVDRWFARAFGVLRRLSTRFGLAFAASFETIAFVGARWMDRRQRLLRNADPQVATLFLWHLAEEVEHKRVAFDAYQASGGGRLRHAAAMVTAALVLSIGAFVASLALLRATGRLWRPAAHLQLLAWSLSFVFAAVPVMVVSLLPGHHPDQLVDPAGLEHWLDHLDPATASVPEWALP